MKQHLFIQNVTLRSILYTILIRTCVAMLMGAGILALFSTEFVHAQPNERLLMPLEEADYECLKQLQCVTKSEELREKGWFVTFDESIYDYPLERTAKMRGKDLSITARYDKEGKLQRAIYKRKDIALPRALLAHLAGADFSGWTMIANTMTVWDFDMASTEYQVSLENESVRKIVTFTYADLMNIKKQTSSKIVENH